ncbi:hypothetical protein [Ruthenibacterium lactatiformans]|uniref:Uncharacterized protein n=1 Tax=Ruthenibacterium lactatiformans TaxID=1550024 RepID=A0A6L6LUX6_9FIRM|nr:hypothetical protein [Ruthenibacterium lactatiformans]MTQ81596.1 hypothetical protein [Ruthenibacterium lactatiformans]MTS21535.1 hypothetical protein [Ruthenibacterium lactatiformans]MTS28555.1 hypothetical protein [Ruthenibacterium lactatiformans]MTS32267.1 hypothetical protein [Ruthenibacterium lactatiformans]MTS38856.1 hypothetical protein [Ruthenibacterium lactatiformans]
MEKKIHEIMRGIMLDEHALDRSKSRGSFPEAEDLANYFEFQALRAPSVVKLLTAFRKETLFASRQSHLCLALKWTGFEIPNTDLDEDDIKTDAVFFFRGNIDGMYLDSMLFYPLEAGGCKNCFLDADDAKFHYTAQGKMTHWETGWTEK